MDLKEFTKKQLKKEIKLIEKRIIKLDSAINNNNEILENQKTLKIDLEQELQTYKQMESVYC